MSKIIKIVFILIGVTSTVLFYQNCKIQKTEDGKLQSVQKLPERMEQFVFAKGFSAEVSESVEHVEIDIKNNKVIAHKRDLGAPGNDMCRKEVDLDANTRAEFLDKYDKANYCYRTVKADPDVFCTLEIKNIDQFAIYFDGKRTLHDKIGAPDACYSGVILEFCQQEGQDFHDFLKSLRQDMMALCQN